MDLEQYRANYFMDLSNIVNNSAGLYPSTFVFVTHECSSGRGGGGGEARGKVSERFCYFSILEALNG